MGEKAMVIRVAPLWVPKLARLAIAALHHLALLAFLFIGFATLVMLVHPFNHSKHALGFLARSFGDNSLLTLVLPLAIVSYFALDGFLAKRGASDEGAGIRSRPFLFGTATVLLCFAIYWAFDGRHLPAYASRKAALPAGLALFLLPVGLFFSLLFGFFARGGARWGTFAAGFVPVAILVGVALLSMLLRQAVPTVDWTIYQFFDPWVLLLVVLVFGGVALVSAGIEFFALGGLRQTFQLCLVGVWILAAGMQYLFLGMFLSCACVLDQTPVEAPILVAVIWAVAIAARVTHHARAPRK